MIRSQAFSRRMAWLALAAVLLMSAGPTVSRVLAATVSGATPVLMEMCTAAGMGLVDVSPFVGEGAAPAPKAAMGQACDYCALATPLPLLLLLLCALAWRMPRAPALRLLVSTLRVPRNLRGLGSQAPPIAL